MRKNTLLTLNLSIVLLLIISCAKAVKQNINSDKNPYLLLISIDGYRHDYTKIHNPPNISKFKEEASYAKSLRPAFPSKTFPNHYTLVTGLYPDHHGIIANSFYDREKNRRYTLSKREEVVKGDYYGGTPIWNLVQMNKMRSAIYFWPGSEANIQGMLPTYWIKYNKSNPHEKRVKQIIEWFNLPKASRPNFVSLYFSDVDTAGHVYGPTSPKTTEAVLKVDKTLGILFKLIKELPFKVNIVIVSDHGMAATSKRRTNYLDSIFKTKSEKELFSRFELMNNGPLVHFYYKGKNRETDLIKMVNLVNKSANNFKMYRREDIPKMLHFYKNDRIGDLLIIADSGHRVGTKEKLTFPKGDHGYDPYMCKDMHAIFYAKGPRINKNVLLDTIDNINIYPFLAGVLNITPPENIDGNVQATTKLLK